MTTVNTLIGIGQADFQTMLTNCIEEALRRAKEQLPQLLTIEETMQMLKIKSRTTIYNMVSDGRLHPIVANNKTLFCKEQIENDMRKGKL